MRRFSTPLRVTAALAICGSLAYGVQVASAEPAAPGSPATPQARVDLNVQFSTQIGSNWCWAATGLYTSQYMGTNQELDQNTFCLIGRGMQNSARRCPDEPAEMVNVQRGYRHGKMNVGRGIRVASFDQVKQNIDAGAPIPAGYYWSGGGGHMVHIAGYDPSSQEIKVNNTLRGERRTTWFRYNDFVRNGKWRWAESIVGHSYQNNPGRPTPTQPPRPTQPPQPTRPPWPPRPTQPPQPTQPPRPTNPNPWPPRPTQPPQPPRPTQPQPTRPRPTWPGFPGWPGRPGGKKMEVGPVAHELFTGTHVFAQTSNAHKVKDASHKAVIRNLDVQRSVAGLFASLRSEGTTARLASSITAEDRASYTDDAMKLFTLNPDFVRGTSSVPYQEYAVGALATTADGERAVVFMVPEGDGLRYSSVTSGDEEIRYASQAGNGVVFAEPQIAAYYRLEGSTVYPLNDAAREGVSAHGITVSAYQALVAQRYGDKLEGSEYQRKGLYGGLNP